MALEFAFAGVVFIVLAIGLLEFCRYFWERGSIEYAVNVAARYVMVNPSASDSQITNEVTSNLTSPSTNLTVSVVTTVEGGVTYKTIAATKDFNFVTNLLPDNVLNINVSSKAPAI